MLLISPATRGRRVIKLDDGNTEREKAGMGNEWKVWRRQETAAANCRIITANSASRHFKSLFMHDWPQKLCLWAAKTPQKQSSIYMLMLPAFSHPNTPPNVPIFPGGQTVTANTPLWSGGGAAFKAQIDVSDIIVSLHKTVGRGSRGRSLAGGFGSKLTVVCNIKHFPDPRTGVNLWAITDRRVAWSGPHKGLWGANATQHMPLQAKWTFIFWNWWGRWCMFLSSQVRTLLNTCSLLHKQADVGVDAHVICKYQLTFTWQSFKLKL